MLSLFQGLPEAHDYDRAIKVIESECLITVFPVKTVYSTEAVPSHEVYF